MQRVMTGDLQIHFANCSFEIKQNMSITKLLMDD